MKKNKGPVSPTEALENLMKNIPLENEADIMKMLDSIMQPGEYEQHMNEQFFRSNHKDYASMCKPLSEMMLPLFHARQPRDVVNAYNDILNKMKPMAQEVREVEVRNFLLNLLAEKDKRMDDSSTSCLYLYGILAVMEHYDITSAADLLIELLCQDMFFYAYYFNGYEDTAELAYSKLCRNALGNLKTYMLETGHIPDMKWIVLDAVTYRAVMHPEDRLAVVSFLSGVLGEMVKMQNVYEITVERLIYCLACLRATEALPIIEQAMNLFQIQGLLISDGFKGVKDLMKSGCTLINEITDNSVEEMLVMVADYADNHPDGSDEEDMDFPFDFDEEDDDSYGDDILADWLVDDVDHVKDYHLSVKLLNAPIPVTRELVVPNNIDMLTFEDVLIMAMGWNGSHLSQFHKGGNFYMREDFLDDDSILINSTYLKCRNRLRNTCRILNTDA